MDNLGVAMNDTTMKAYALSKGMSESAYKNLDTQGKIGLAFEMFMDKTSQYAGNYAKENDTLAGSMNTLQAAWEDFLSGAGNADAVIDSGELALKAIGKTAGELIPKLWDGATKMFKKAWPKITKWLGDAFKKLPAGLGNAVANGANGLIDIINSTFDTNIPHINIEIPDGATLQEAAQAVWDGLVEWAAGVGGLIFGRDTETGEVNWPDLEDAAGAVWAALGEAVAWFGGLIFGRDTETGEVNWPSFEEMAQAVWDALSEAVAWFGGLIFGRDTETGEVNWPSLEDAAQGIWSALGEAVAWFGGLIFGRDTETGEVNWPSLEDAAQGVWDALGEAVAWFGGLLFGRDTETGDVNWPDLEGLAQSAWDGLIEAVSWFGGLLFGSNDETGDVNWPDLEGLAQTVWNGLLDAVSWFGGLLFGSNDDTGDVNWPDLEGLAQGVWNGLLDAVSYFGGLLFGSNDETGDVNWPDLVGLADTVWEGLKDAVAWFGGLYFGRDDETGDVNWPDLEGLAQAVWDGLVEWVATLGGLVFGNSDDGSVAWPNLETISTTLSDIWDWIQGAADGLGGFIFGRNDDGSVAWPEWTTELAEAADTAFQSIQSGIDSLGGFVFGYKTGSDGNPVVNWPSGEQIAAAATEWWEGVKAEAESAIEWIMNAPNKPNATGLYIHGLVTSWWNTVKSIAMSALQWFLGTPGISDKDGTKTKTRIENWWNNIVKPLLSGVLDFSLGLLGLPDAATIADQMHDWARDIIAKIGEKLGLDMSFLFPQQGLTNVQKIASLREVVAKDDHSLTGVWKAQEVFRDLKNYSDLWGQLSKEQQQTIENGSYDYEFMQGVVETLTGSLSEAEAAELSTTTSLEGLGGAATHASEALNSIPSFGGGDGGGTQHGGGGHSFAKGLNYVPYDGFVAELHRGEQVLTASQARHEGEGGGFGVLAAVVSDLKSTLTSLRIQVGEKEFGSTVADYGSSRIRRNISGFDRKRRMGYGSI